MHRVLAMEQEEGNMLEILKKEAIRTLTENGAETYATTTDCCLDLFSTIGALRNAESKEIMNRFIRAFAEDRTTALRIAFFARDIRGGLGERRVFRVILKYLALSYPQTMHKNLRLVPEYGRWDDLMELMNTPCEQEMMRFVQEQLQRDMKALESHEHVSLLGKWLPSVNATNPQTLRMGKCVARALGLSDAAYRKALSSLRAQIGIVENNLRERDYTFDYVIQPSRALFKYRKAFENHDHDRYHAFLNEVAQGKISMHTGALYPYELILPLLSEDCTDEAAAPIEVTWNALPDYTDGRNALVVVDGSGSMYVDVKPMPATIALSLGLYFAQRNSGAFRNHFITFSQRPQLVEIKGKTLLDQVRHCMSYNEIANTNMEAVFRLILDTAVHNGLKQKDLPETLYIVSDMEFDDCADGAETTNFENAKALFEAEGYRLPTVVFWNVASRRLQQPVTKNEQGVALVSGASPHLFEMVMGGRVNPYTFMIDTISSKRYTPVEA